MNSCRTVIICYNIQTRYNNCCLIVQQCPDRIMCVDSVDNWWVWFGLSWYVGDMTDSRIYITIISCFLYIHFGIYMYFIKILEEVPIWNFISKLGWISSYLFTWHCSVIVEACLVCGCCLYCCCFVFIVFLYIDA